MNERTHLPVIEAGGQKYTFAERFIDNWPDLVELMLK
jgi:hypothetical protein